MKSYGIYAVTALSALAQTTCAVVVEEAGVVTATLTSGDSVEIYLHGATVTSWKTGDGDEKLFLSTASAVDGSAAIRGGIPVVFPNFGSAPDDHPASELPSHGFARNSTWTLADEADQESSVDLTFTLSTDSLIAEYQEAWPYTAELTYVVSLSEGNLAVKFTAENTGLDNIDFQFLLHTYLAVPDINTTTVAGLQNAKYQDKLLNYTVFTQITEELSIVGETDRIYTTEEADSPIVLNVDGEPRVTIQREPTLPDVTIWNTWATKILNTKDFEPKDAWQRYLAIEPGAVAKWSVLEPGSTWEGGVLYVA